MLTVYINFRYSGAIPLRKAHKAGEDVQAFLPLPASAMHIIVALAEGEKHGYAIMRDVEQLSGGIARMGPGSMYGSIKRMIDQGLLEESAARPDPALDDERRRYYALTDLGHRVGAAEHARLSRLLSAAQIRRLGPSPGAAT